MSSLSLPNTMKVVPPIPITATNAGGFDIVINGDFSADTDWTLGAGWTISSGTANAAAGAISDISQAAIFRAGGTFIVAFDVTGRTAGGVTPKIGGDSGSQVTTNGSFSQATSLFFRIQEAHFVKGKDRASSSSLSSHINFRERGRGRER